MLSKEALTVMRENDSARQGKWLSQAEADRHDLLKHIDSIVLKLSDALKEVEALRHGNDGNRWNMHKAGDDRIQICFGEHERGTSCEYVTFCPEYRLDSLQKAHDYVNTIVVPSFNDELELARSRLAETEKAYQTEREAYGIAVNQAMENGAKALAAESRLDIGEKELARVVAIKNQALADFAALRVERDAIASRLDAASDAWRKMMTDGSPADERQAAKWELLAALEGRIVEIGRKEVDGSG